MCHCDVIRGEWPLAQGWSSFSPVPKFNGYFRDQALLPSGPYGPVCSASDGPVGPACFTCTGIQMGQRKKGFLEYLGCQLVDEWQSSVTHLVADTFRRMFD